jgi:hypothetical protein
MTSLRVNGNEQQRAGMRLPVGPIGALMEAETDSVHTVEYVESKYKVFHIDYQHQRLIESNLFM